MNDIRYRALDRCYLGHSSLTESGSDFRAKSDSFEVLREIGAICPDFGLGENFDRLWRGVKTLYVVLLGCEQ